MNFLIDFIKNYAVFLSKDKNHNSEEVASIFLVLVGNISTAPLMWSYALNAYLTIDNIYGLKVLGIIYALTHLFSPLLYLLIPSTVLVTYVFISSGFIFQFHHALATGGLYSGTVIWFSILPLIVGVVLNLKHMFVWGGIAVLGVIAHGVLTYNGVVYDAVSPVGRVWSQLNIAIGYIVVNLALILAYADFRSRSMAALEKKERKIRSLFRILIHDVSNPLTFISFGLSKLKKSLSSPEQVEDLENIEHGTQVIFNIVNTTREYESISTKSASLKLVQTNLLGCIREALKILAPRIEKKQIEFKVNVENDLFVLSDPNVLMSQVFMNIFSNAIKFSHEKSVIEVRASDPEFGSRSKVNIEIQDYGVGISEELLENLFDQESVITMAGTQGESGTGLGMPIVAMMMKKFNGDISVKTQTGENSGTCFILTFNRA